MTRDMTKAEYTRQCRRYGFEPQGFMGYYRLPGGRGTVRVSVLNAGPRLRDRLAYLIRENEKLEAEAPAT